MGWVAYSPMSRRFGPSGSEASPLYQPSDIANTDGEPLRPEVADLTRLTRRLVRKTVGAARADEAPTLARLLTQHLGQRASSLPVVRANCPAYDY